MDVNYELKPKPSQTRIGIGHGSKRRSLWPEACHDAASSEPEGVGRGKCLGIWVWVCGGVSVRHPGLGCGAEQRRMDPSVVHIPTWHSTLAALQVPRFNEPYTTFDLGWDREVWPEFTRSQLHVLYDVGFTENPQRNSKFHISPMEVAFVSLSNRSDAFESWLADDLNPGSGRGFNTT